MSIGTDAETKKKIIADYATDANDTGSPEVQIALLSHRISHLTEHLKQHKHDHHRRRGLLPLGGQRPPFLDHLPHPQLQRSRPLGQPLPLPRRHPSARCALD